MISSLMLTAAVFWSLKDHKRFQFWYVPLMKHLSSNYKVTPFFIMILSSHQLPLYRLPPLTPFQLPRRPRFTGGGDLETLSL
jgi:hypothetical protein